VTSAAAVPVRHVEHCMGTVFSIDVRAPGVDGATLARVVEWLHWVDATFSTYRPESQISRLGRGELTPEECAPEVRAVLSRCAELVAETGGYFDCRAGGRLDPSGYVKGWAVERASDLLAAAGASNHCINGGGDVQCRGAAAPGRPWGVGITDPRNPGQTVATVRGNELAVATSGSAERGLHVIDPHTGSRPDALLSVTVVGTRIADVDAYATAAMAMGEQAAEWLTARSATALLIHRDGRSESLSPLLSPPLGTPSSTGTNPAAAPPTAAGPVPVPPDGQLTEAMATATWTSAPAGSP
jgi:FAD:protein FMN transferase